MKKISFYLSIIGLSLLGKELKAQQIPTQDLVVEYNFDNDNLMETSGSSYNAGSLTSSNIVSYTQGIEAGTSALSPDGASLSNVGNITFPANVKEYVVSFWFKAEKDTNSFILLELQDQNNSSYGLTVEVVNYSNNNSSTLWVSQNAVGLSTSSYYNIFENYLDNNWHHIAVKAVYWTGGGKYYLRTFLDNVQVMERQHQISLSSIWLFGGLNVYLPSQTAGNGLSQDLKIDNFRFYEVPIADSDITSLFNEKNTTVGIDDIEPSENISIYPNPTNDNFSIDMGKNIEQLDVQVSNISGKKLYSKSYNNSQKVNLSLNDSPAGVYFVTIVADGVQSNQKLIKN